MQDADEPVGKLAQGGVVLDAGGALGVVEGAGAGELPSAEGAWAMSASMSRSLRMNRAMTIFFFFFPDARVRGEVAA